METQNRPEEQSAEPSTAVFERALSGLQVVTYHAGETVLAGGLQSGQLLILKKGAVVILKDSVEIARVDQPGAVFGEISALLDRRHTADVRALEDSQFHLADAALVKKDPNVLLHVAKILALRLVAADEGLVELKKQLETSQSPGGLRRILEKIQEVVAGKEVVYPFDRYY